MWISNQRRYGQIANWASGLKQHTSLLWNFLKLCPVNDSTPLAHSCTALCYHIAHEQFFARGLCEKLIMARWWQRYTAKNQRIRAGATATCSYRFSIIIIKLCVKKLSRILHVTEMNAFAASKTCCCSSYNGGKIFFYFGRLFSTVTEWCTQHWQAV